MTSDENAVLVLRFLDAAWNQGDASIADELIAPDYVFHGSGQPPGPEGVRRLIPLFRSAFPDAQATWDDVIAADDRVVVRWTTRATHGGAFGGIPATGKAITYTGIDIFRLTDGQIVERWSSSDTLGLLQQMGAL